MILLILFTLFLQSKKPHKDPLIYVTENGVSEQSSEINLSDPKRAQFYEDYIGQMHRAITEDNVNVKMYTAWSLMDNFEWARGYTERFGLHFVDYNSTDRTR